MLAKYKMRMGKKRDSYEYVLKLFISGASPNSVKAINNIQRILDTHVQGKYNLNIIDIYQEKSVAEKEQIIALPLLIRKFPLPEKRLIGDMSDTQRVLEGLGIANEK
jgi:circadian clock protein KaiB